MAVIAGGCVVTPQVDPDLRARALDGNAQAQYEVGERYRRAYEDSISSSMPLWDEAALWYERAAQQGHAESQSRLAMYYFTFHADYERSFFWEEKAAMQGIAEAQGSLGGHYAQGWGTPVDLVQAYKWLTLAEEGGAWDPIEKNLDAARLVQQAGLSPAQIAEGRRLADEHTARYGRSHSMVRSER